MRTIASHVALACLITACSSSQSGTPAPDPGSPAGGEALTVFPTAVYGGKEGSTVYAVPVTVKGGDGSSYAWKSSDVAIAGVSGTGSDVSIMSGQQGQTTVTVTSGGKSATVSVNVVAYAVGAAAAGATAYQKYSCKGCHEASDGADITPSGIGKHTDDEIRGAVIKGQNPEGGEVEIGAAAHSFAIAPSDPAYEGIVAYLRSLAPKTNEPAEDATPGK